MKKLVEAMLDDLSTREVFLFQTRCDACGREYKSKPLRFSKAGVMPQTQEKLYMSVRTVKQLIQSMRDKTGFRNRTALAVRARESGLVINDHRME